MNIRNLTSYNRSKIAPNIFVLWLNDNTLVHINTDYLKFRDSIPDLQNIKAFLFQIKKSQQWCAEYSRPDSSSNGYYGINSTSFDDTLNALQIEYEKVWNEFNDRIANPAVNLEYELSRHDWYYQYSDDHSVWSSGETHWKKIEGLIKEVTPEVAKELLEKYAPKE